MQVSENRIELGTTSELEKAAGLQILDILNRDPVPQDERIDNLHVFLKRQTLSRLLFLSELFSLILETPGSIVQCGVRWGGDLVTFTSLRGILEPYNYSRRIVGFDTFTGLAGTSKKDAGSATVHDGQFSVTTGYAETLASLLEAHEALSPLPHIRKFELIAGDARSTVPDFLSKNGGEAIALLYLDMDIYEPTKSVLEACYPRMAPGSIIVFDEFADRRFPGEAAAFFETIKSRSYRLQRSKISTVGAFVILE